MKCFSCQGPWHPSTGDYDKKYNVYRCGTCMIAFYAWFKGHSKRKWGKERFYDHALTSIKPKEK